VNGYRNAGCAFAAHDHHHEAKRRVLPLRQTAASRFMMMLFLRAGGKKVILELNEYSYATEGRDCKT